MRLRLFFIIAKKHPFKNKRFNGKKYFVGLKIQSNRNFIYKRK